MMPPIEIELEISASSAKIWRYLTTPVLMREWMGGDDYQVQIEADWRVGGSLRIQAFHIMAFENRGTILALEPERLLEYNTLSNLSHLPDTPENHTLFRYELIPQSEITLLKLRITQFPTEAIYHHLEFYWRATRYILQAAIEQGAD